jgi:hypothetical protein
MAEHEQAIEVAVVGHTNAGKTSLLRTLTRRADFGTVSERPGTTRHVEAIELMVDGRPALRFFDTPGLEDSTALMARLRAQDATPTATRSPPERIRAFLATPEATGRFEQEAKVLRALLGVEAAFYVVDTRDPVLPKHRAELEALSWCARPVLPVLNFVRDESSREADWTAALSEYGLHAIVRFDAVAPFTGAEQRLYQDLATLLRPREALLAEVAEALDFERLERRRASLSEIAALLVSAAATRRTLPREQVAQDTGRSREVESFRAAVFARTRACITALLEIQAFAPDDARLDDLPWLDGRWESDLFNAEALGRAGQALGTGALIGAGVGLAADVALAGLSLGAAATLGAAVGGAASQGFSGVGHAVANLVRRRVDLTVEDQVLALLADQMLALLLTLEGRGHAASQAVTLHATLDPARQSALRGLLAALAPARAHPEWGIGTLAGGGVRRDRVIDEVVTSLRDLAGQAAK